MKVRDVGGVETVKDNSIIYRRECVINGCEGDARVMVWCYTIKWVF